VEVRAPLLGDRQGIEEQVDEEGLAAADATPQVQAGNRDVVVARKQFRQETAALGRCDQRGVDAVEFGQRRMLRGIVLPVAARDPGGVRVRRRHAAGR